MLRTEVDLSDLDRYIKEKTRAFSNLSQPSELSQAFEKLGEEYLSNVQKRFLRYSDGGGDWAPLALSTIRKRKAAGQYSRKKKGSKTTLQFAILRATGALYASLFRGDVNNIFQLKKDALEVGSKDPKINFHHEGNQHLPRRRVIVAPTDSSLGGQARLKSVFESSVRSWLTR